MSRAYIVSFPGIQSPHFSMGADRSVLAQLELSLDGDLEQLLVDIDYQETAGRALAQQFERLSVDLEAAQRKPPVRCVR